MLGFLDGLSFKKIKRAIRHLIRWIKYRIDPELLTKKERKKVERGIEERKLFSFKGNILRFFCGLWDTKVRCEDYA